jgi:hypothetical protein
MKHEFIYENLIVFYDNNTGTYIFDACIIGLSEILHFQLR